MDQMYMTGENAANVISSWCFQQTVKGESEETKVFEEREELERQQRLLEYEKQEFIRTKTLEEKRMEQEKRLFEMKWKMLEEEWRKLVVERERVERRKAFFSKVEDFEAGENSKTNNSVSVSVFFSGVKNMSTLKKRYKELSKIFHPDNASGDLGVIQQINQEYETLKKCYGKA